MNIDSRYSKKFYSDKLSDKKYHEIYTIAMSINKVKNEISKQVNSNIFHYIEMSNFDFQKEMLPFVKDKINSHFVKQLLDDVYVSYQNKFEAIKNKLQFKVVSYYSFTYYKRNTKTHKSGDFKGASKKLISTPLSITLTYLIRYGNEKIVDYLNEKYKTETNEQKQEFYKKILDNINKYGFERLMQLAKSKKDRIIKKYSENPIIYKSLSFRGRSRLTSDIVSYNKNYNSMINSFINISWNNFGRKKMTIPIKYSKKYHKDMKRYTNGTDTSYTICFDDNKNKIKIIISYQDSRYFPDDCDNYVGIDINSKHNLFQCSNGDTIDFDRKLVETLSKEMLKTDKLKSRNNNYVIGKQRLKKINHLQRELISKIQNEISNLCKRFNQQGINHQVFENLTGFEEKCFCKDENDLNYNRRVRLLKLSSLKDEFEHIQRKYNIAVSLVHSYYTSQQCPKCGCIDGDNRKSQEDFECVECGYKQNADLNASINIKQRVVSTVLRNELLKNNKIGNNSFLPKTLNKFKVKEKLLQLRCNSIIE